MQPPDLKNNHPSALFLGVDALMKIKGDALNYYKNLHTQYGDAAKVQLGPYRCWFLFHPDHVEQVLAKQADKFIRFRKIMNIIRQWNGNSLLIAEGNSWKERRRKVLPAFKQQRIPEYSKMVVQHASEFSKGVTDKIKTNGSYQCSIDNVMAQYALDIAGITLFGKKLGSSSKEISEAVHGLSEIAYSETISPLTLPSFIPSTSNIHKRHVIRVMKDTISAIVCERLSAPDNDHGDLLSILIEHHEHNQTAIEEDVMSLLIAGHETSGATLSWLFLLLAKNQTILRHVQDELDDVITGDFPEHGDLMKLPYLTATIKEVMRLYPAPYALFCREAVENVDLGNLSIKKGDLVQLLPYITQRDKRWFDTPLEFRPERFLNEEAWPKYAYFPFGAGPRVCIGKSFGMMEVVLTAATILKNHTIKPIDRIPEASPRFSLRPNGHDEIVFMERSK
jgi:cytochrome P450